MGRSRSQRGLTGAIALCLVAGVITISSPAAAHGRPRYDIERRDYIVPTRHGDIFVQVAHPVRGTELVKGPALFTYSPYSILGVPPNYRRNGDARDWVPFGYHRVWADVVGTGNSGGCWDYGGKREKRTAYKLVEWIADQPWSTGKVAMFGGSYEGTTANAAAVTRPPHLKTIVPIAAISRWYGYAYSGGIRYAANSEIPSDEGLDTPAAFDYGLALPPPLDPQDPGWAERVLSTSTPCDEVQHTEHGYDGTPDYDAFWRERDYVRHARRVRIPVLVAHNWGDWNVKQEEGFKFFKGLRNSRKRAMFFGSRYHGHGSPGGTFDQTLHRWFDHYLMGVNNGIRRFPKITTQKADYEGARKFVSRNHLPTRKIRLVAQEVGKKWAHGYKWKLLPRRPPNGKRGRRATFESTGSNTESNMLASPRSNEQWFWFETPILRRRARIFGSPKVRIQSRVHRRWITYTPTVVDVDPECRTDAGQPTCGPRDLHSVTRGWLDSRYRKGLSKRVPLKPGKAFRMRIVEKPQDYTFKKGHYIGLAIQTEINEWSLPKPYECETEKCSRVKILWKRGKTRLVLPVVNGPRRPWRLFRR